MQPLGDKDPKSIADFTLIGRLGAGGMGIVYLASRRSESVALKVVRDSLIDDPSEAVRFSREVETLTGINHPNVARVIDAGVDDNRAWFAVEFANGPNLAARVADKGPLPEDEWWELAKGLFAGLAAVHANGVIHRDIKPANVILSESGPKLIDFGIAHISDATSVTATGMVAGSPAWFSPEQIEGAVLTPATDIFSAGSLLTFAATGRSPWGDQTTMTKASVLKILTHEPDLSGLSEAQLQLVSQLLAKEPGDRPSAEGVLAELGVTDAVKSTSSTPTRVSLSTTPIFGDSKSRVSRASSTVQSARNRFAGKSPVERRPLRRIVLGVSIVLALVVTGSLVSYVAPAQGTLRIATKLNSSAISTTNPLVGAPALAIDLGNRDSVTIDTSKIGQSPGLFTWKSGETLTIRFDGSYSEDEPLVEKLDLSKLGITGWDSGKDILLTINVTEKAFELSLNLGEENGQLLFWKSTARGNEKIALDECFAETEKIEKVILEPHEALKKTYYSQRKDAKLNAIGTGTLTLSYSEWASRARKLSGSMEKTLSARPDKSSNSRIGNSVASVVKTARSAYKELSDAWAHLGDISAKYQNSGVPSKMWSDAWDRIYAAQAQMDSLSTNHFSTSSEFSSQIDSYCGTEIQ